MWKRVGGVEAPNVAGRQMSPKILFVALKSSYSWHVCTLACSDMSLVFIYTFLYDIYSQIYIDTCSLMSCFCRE